MEERIRVLGRTAWWLIGITIVAAIVGFFGWTIRVVFPPLVLAGIIVFLANPVVTRLHRRGLPRVLGAAITYVGFFLGVGLLGLILSPLLGNQFDQLSERLPELRRDVENVGLRVVERTGILTLPGILRMADLFFYTRGIPLYRLSNLFLAPFQYAETRWRWPGRFGYLLTVVADKAP